MDFLKKPLQDLLSSVNAVISTNERIEFITGHMTYNPDYTLSLTDDNHHGNFIMSPSCGQSIHFEFTIWIRKNHFNLFSFVSLYIFHSFSFAGKIMYYSCLFFHAL